MTNTPHEISKAGRERELHNLLHEFNREMNYSENAPLPPLERRAIKQKYVEQIMSHILSQEVKLLEGTKDLIIKLVADEAIICHKEGVPTSRLTSLAMRYTEAIQEEIKKIKP